MGDEQLTENGTLHIDTYYSSLPALRKRFDRYAHQDRFTGSTAAEHTAWQERARKTLIRLLALDRIEPVEKPECRIAERTTLPDGIVREHLYIETEPGIVMPVYILIPPGEITGVFIALPGHQGGGKYSVAGRYDIPAVRKKIDFFNYDYGMKLAKLHYVAVCPDCRGFGERRDHPLQDDEPQHFLAGSCRNLANMALPMGLTVLGLCTWDNMRLVDYLYARGEWDVSKLGCLGFSGGGMQTLYLSALDQRIRQAVVSGYFYGFQDSLMILNGNCACNYVPGLWEHFDMGDLLALSAPKPVLVQSCREDHLNGPRGLVNVTEQMEITKKAYQLYGREPYLKHDIREGGHHFHDEPLSEVLAEFQTLL